MAEAVDSTEVQQPAAGDEDDRKLFVGGLPQDASQVLINKCAASLFCCSGHLCLLRFLRIYRVTGSSVFPIFSDRHDYFFGLLSDKVIHFTIDKY
jgi:hypothetical protein